MFLLLSILLFTNYSSSQSYEVNSLDNKIKLIINLEGSISWSAFLDGISIIENAEIGMVFSNGSDFGGGSTVENHSIEKIGN